MFREEMHILQTLVRVDTRTHNRATVSLCPAVSYCPALRYLSGTEHGKKAKTKFVEFS